MAKRGLIGILVAVPIIIAIIVFLPLDAPQTPLTNSTVPVPTIASPQSAESNKTIVVSSDQTQDFGEKIMQANADCGNLVCEIRLANAGPIKTAVVLSDNRILTLASGTYTVSATIDVGNNNEIRGVSSNATILKRDPSFYEGLANDLRTNPPGDLNQIANADLLRVSSRHDVYIHDLGFDGSTTEIGWYPLVPQEHNIGKVFQMPKGNQPELKLKDASNVTISHIMAKEGQTNDLLMVGVSNVTVANSNFTTNGWNRFQLVELSFKENKNVVLSGNYISGSSHAGLYIELAENVTIVNNIFDHNRVNTYFTGGGGQIGIQERAHDIKIVNNTIINSGYTPASEIQKGKPILGHGIAIHGYNISILGNKIEDNNGAGIALHFGDNADSPAKFYPHDIDIENNIIRNNGLVPLGQDVGINQDEGPIENITIRNNVGVNATSNFKDDFVD